MNKPKTTYWLRTTSTLNIEFVKVKCATEAEHIRVCFHFIQTKNKLQLHRLSMMGRSCSRLWITLNVQNIIITFYLCIMFSLFTKVLKNEKHSPYYHKTAGSSSGKKRDKPHRHRLWKNVK